MAIGGIPIGTTDINNAGTALSSSHDIDCQRNKSKAFGRKTARKKKNKSNKKSLEVPSTPVPENKSLRMREVSHFYPEKSKSPWAPKPLMLKKSNERKINAEKEFTLNKKLFDQGLQDIQLEDSNIDKLMTQVDALNYYAYEVFRCYLHKHGLTIHVSESIKEFYNSCHDWQYPHLNFIADLFSKLVDVNSTMLRNYFRFHGRDKSYLNRQGEQYSSDLSEREESIVQEICLWEGIVINHYYKTAILRQNSRNPWDTYPLYKESLRIYNQCTYLLTDEIFDLLSLHPQTKGSVLIEIYDNNIQLIFSNPVKDALIYMANLQSESTNSVKNIKKYMIGSFRKPDIGIVEHLKNIASEDGKFVIEIKTLIGMIFSRSLCYLASDTPHLALHEIITINQYLSDLLSNNQQVDKEKERTILIQGILNYHNFIDLLGFCQLLLYKLALYNHNDDLLPDTNFIDIYSHITRELDKYIKLFYTSNQELKSFEGEQTTRHRRKNPTDRIHVGKDEDEKKTDEKKTTVSSKYFYDSLYCLENAVEEIKWLTIKIQTRNYKYKLDYQNQCDFADTYFEELIKQEEREKLEENIRTNKKYKTRICTKFLSHYQNVQTDDKDVHLPPEENNPQSENSDFHPIDKVDSLEEADGNLLMAISKYGKEPFEETEKRILHIAQTKINISLREQALIKYTILDLSFCAAKQKIEKLKIDKNNTKFNQYEILLKTKDTTNETFQMKLKYGRIFLLIVREINETQEKLNPLIDSIKIKLQDYLTFLSSAEETLYMSDISFNTLTYEFDKLKENLIKINKIRERCLEIYTLRGESIKQDQQQQNQYSYRKTSEFGVMMKTNMANMKNPSGSGEKLNKFITAFDALDLEEELNGLFENERINIFQCKKPPSQTVVDARIKSTMDKIECPDLQLNLKELETRFTTIRKDHANTGYILPTDLTIAFCDSMENIGQYIRNSARSGVKIKKQPWEVESLFFYYVSKLKAKGKLLSESCKLSDTSFLERYDKREIFILPGTVGLQTVDSEGRWLEEDTSQSRFDDDMTMLSDAMGINIYIAFEGSGGRLYQPNFEQPVPQASSPPFPVPEVMSTIYLQYSTNQGFTCADLSKLSIGHKHVQNDSGYNTLAPASPPPENDTPKAITQEPEIASTLSPLSGR